MSVGDELKVIQAKVVEAKINGIVTGVFFRVPSYSLTSLSFPATFLNHLRRLVD